MRSGTPAIRAASAGRIVRSRIQTRRNFSRAQQRGEPRQIDRAFELRALMLEIDHFADARLGLQQLLGVGRGQREKRHLAFRLLRRDRADERQMPDHIADALLDLDDGGGRHVYSEVRIRAEMTAADHIMRTDLFDFDLPPERIALRPARPRDAARLLVVRPGGALEDRVVRDLPDLLQPGDQLVVNDTRVIPASLHGRRIGRGPETRIEANLDQAARRLALAGLREARQSASRRATRSASATRARCASSASSTRPWRQKARAAR